MTENLFVVFLIVWFGFWGWMLANKPGTFFKTNEMGQENMRRGFGGIGKVILFGLKLFKK